MGTFCQFLKGSHQLLLWGVQVGGVSGALCCALGGLRKGGRSVLTLRGTRRPIRRRHSPVRDVRRYTDDISGERERRSLRESGAGTHEVEVVGRGVDEVEPLLRDLGRVQGRDPDPAASDGAEIARTMHGGEQQRVRRRVRRRTRHAESEART